MWRRRANQPIQARLSWPRPRYPIHVELISTSSTVEMLRQLNKAEVAVKLYRVWVESQNNHVSLNIELGLFSY
ncbi:U3 small nucleolar RNA-associated protein 10 [Fusarium oxysporum f. sp. albedinis]|nr:U3 small nucleolar RNA-associated protein 10 [Fusarium oxysporum f. sp. albedinis]